MLNALNDTVQTHTDKINHLESKMADLYSAHNDLVDTFAYQESEIQHLQNKIPGLEDRSRWNNINFRGILESIPPVELTNFLQRLIKTLIPTPSNIKLCIDRAPQIPKPKFLPDTAPRDTLARIPYFYIKKRAMVATKQNLIVPDKFTGILLYVDISQQTKLNQKKLSPLTKDLWNNNIPYKWGFPTKQIVRWNGKTVPIYSVEKGIQLLKQWQLIPMDVQSADPSPLRRLDNEWTSALQLFP